jgi:hypothetical protein
MRELMIILPEELKRENLRLTVLFARELLKKEVDELVD